jgi:Histidine kinase-, DNA gyrase B-, and HSP90-like ATPase
MCAVVEILTSGMYVSPVTIYREYIQNAADSIDDARSQGIISGRQHGRVSVDFDHSARSVLIRDNGTGVSSRSALSTLLAIGASPKRGTQARGFRGVGRLSGLAYCRVIVFRTKASNDDRVTTITWDCRALRERLADAMFDGDLKRVISDVVSVSYDKSEKSEDHFFEVHLNDIARLRNDILLNEAAISYYLAQVAPLPFASDFSFAAEIEKHLQSRLHRTPIELTVDGAEVFRPHRDEITFPATSHKLRIQNIQFLEFADVDGETGAIGWIGHHEYVRSIPPTLGIRGLRARFGDVQVGESGLFDDSFKESRFNGWTVGEVHVLDRRIVPNARRDNFEINHHYSNLLVQLGPVAASLSQHCRSASVARNATQVVQNVIEEVGGRLKQRRPFDRAELSRLKSSVLRARLKAKRIVDEQLRSRLEAKLDRLKAALQKATPKRGASAVALDEALRLVSKIVTNRDQGQRLVEALRLLCK